MLKKIVVFALFFQFMTSCNKNDADYETISEWEAVDAMFGNRLDLNNLHNYSNQDKPTYITKDNSAGNQITDKGATLGRVLFYDKNLSANNAISCANCHQQAFAFSDDDEKSIGIQGPTHRHSMRLVNARFSEESRFFWDERASTLEMQTTMPIKDHIEMGFSGTNGDENFGALISKLSQISYYRALFKFVYGNEEITETKIQLALAQFVRSIQSFDSKYDFGRATAMNDLVPFENFTEEENLGKQLFMTAPIFNRQSLRTSGGVGCISCHRAPEFDIDPLSKNNGIVGSLNGENDYSVTRSPSLRNVVNPEGVLNGPLMHTGRLISLESVVIHYGNLGLATTGNPNLDPRLEPNENFGQELNLTATEINAVVAFLKTLSGNDVYTNEKWSNPFE